MRSDELISQARACTYGDPAYQRATEPATKTEPDRDRHGELVRPKLIEAAEKLYPGESRTVYIGAGQFTVANYGNGAVYIGGDTWGEKVRTKIDQAENYAAKFTPEALGWPTQKASREELAERYAPCANARYYAQQNLAALKKHQAQIETLLADADHYDFNEKEQDALQYALELADMEAERLEDEIADLSVDDVDAGGPELRGAQLDGPILDETMNAHLEEHQRLLGEQVPHLFGDDEEPVTGTLAREAADRAEKASWLPGKIGTELKCTPEQAEALKRPWPVNPRANDNCAMGRPCGVNEGCWNCEPEPEAQGHRASPGQISALARQWRDGYRSGFEGLSAIMVVPAFTKPTGYAQVLAQLQAEADAIDLDKNNRGKT